ncbi:GTPase-activating protein [Lithospermum erythrorhizon]|uniref:GTPase-activating protein n=1 Tax=Lithospermum erythrorhizon TaxID=34254 RepID=A0AAV3PXK2_LITER
MAIIQMDNALIEKGSSGEGIRRRFSDLRGVDWRIELGILPSSSSSSIDELRRVTADSRRRYASLRRQLLLDHHISKNGSNAPDLIIDNPLSQCPDSMWGRFFKNAELERMVDQDLSRLYPEHGSYFQTPGCQGMLRRILLLWCLGHPQYGYRQGMHELLAPLLYVLRVDVEYLVEVRKIYEDYFTDRFDGFSFHENDLTYKFDFKKFSDNLEDGNGSEKVTWKIKSLGDLDPKIQVVVLISDAYGAEGELGTLLSEKFMEHDTYCMFDAFMNGAAGAVAMAEFFSLPALGSSHSGFPPVLEASASLYHLLSLVDSSVHTHLVELGVEPQYFALRWIRVLFGREFALSDLLTIWDEIFSYENSKLGRSPVSDAVTVCEVLDSSRGAFILAFAVSMILYLRSSLLACETATSCLQRLLNFPEDVNLGKLVEKAKSLQALAMEANNSTPLLIHAGLYDGSKSRVVRGHSNSLDLSSPRTPLSSVPDSYWEERWRDMHKEEEHKQGTAEVPNRKIGSQMVRMRLSRTESDPTSLKVDDIGKIPVSSVRKSLLDDLARQLGSDEDSDEIEPSDGLGHQDPARCNKLDRKNNVNRIPELGCSSEKTTSETSSIFLECPSPLNGDNNREHVSGSSVASNSAVEEIANCVMKVDLCRVNSVGSPLPVSDHPEDIPLESDNKENSFGRSNMGIKERKLLQGKFPWPWKFGRQPVEGTSEKGGAFEAAKPCNDLNSQSMSVVDSVEAGRSDLPSGTSKGETGGQTTVTLRKLGQSMCENIQVIESVLQQEKSQAGVLESFLKNVQAGKGQVTALAALEELRKISNLLSQMDGDESH